MFRQPRQHDEKHLARVRQWPCLVCLNDIETEAAHIRYADECRGKRWCGKSEKPDDRWTVPMCGNCHRRQHTMNEREFWELAGIDPLDIAAQLYAAPDHETGERIIRALH